MTANEWLVICSTLAGPVLAVQAQKWVERARESVQRRNLIFSTLMATRQSRVSIDHVRALNAIDMAFYGRRVLGWVWRGAKAQAVLDSWHDYHAHLSIENRPTTEAEVRDWNGRGDELFTNLLDRLATATNFKFERAQLKTGSYSPDAHLTVELELQAVRRLVIDVLSGKQALPMEIKNAPVNQEALEYQKAILEQQKTVQGQLVEILDRLSKQK